MKERKGKENTCKGEMLQKNARLEKYKDLFLSLSFSLILSKEFSSLSWYLKISLSF